MECVSRQPNNIKKELTKYAKIYTFDALQKKSEISVGLSAWQPTKKLTDMQTSRKFRKTTMDRKIKQQRDDNDIGRNTQTMTTIMNKKKEERNTTHIIMIIMQREMIEYVNEGKNATCVWDA